jgi:Zn finger protein HypA/HybF involved in hydrogenase expression
LKKKHLTIWENRAYKGQNTSDQKLIEGVGICQYCKRQCGEFVKWHEEVCKRSFIKTSRVVSADGYSNPHINRVEVKSRGRKCRQCGKDPKPNYFYCPRCHANKYDLSTNG